MVASALIPLAALGGATWARARRRARAAEAAYPPDGDFVTVAGRRVHVVTMGAGPDLVLIHGASGSTRDLTFDLAPELAKRYRVLIPDRPGFGWSDPIEDDSLAAQSRVLQQAVAQRGAPRPIVAGHSYGGAVALNWAVNAPETVVGLVLFAAPSQTWDGAIPWLYRVTAPPLGQRVAVPLLSAWTPASVLRSEVASVFAPQTMPEGYDRWFGPEMTLRPQTMRINARQRAGLMPQIAAMIPRYPLLDLPVVSLHGTADTIVGHDIHARPLTDQVPQAELVSLPGIGHMLPHVALEACVAGVDRVAARLGLI